MRPSALYEALAGDSDLVALGITPSRIKEYQSSDSRPLDSGYFLVIRMNEFSYNSTVERGPRNVEVRCHTPWDRTRDYDTIEQILARVDEIYRGIEQMVGQDDTVISQVRKTGQSENARDEGWQTLVAWCTYHVHYS